jgi:nucleoside-diphosphate-sugar epimerase
MNIYNSKTYISDLQTALEASNGIQELEGKSILVTGATGTIGSFIVDMLMEYNKSDAQIEVYAAGRSVDKMAARFDAIKSSQLHYIEYDVLKPITFDFKADYIIHAGGNAHPVAFNTDPVGTIIGNINGTYNLLEYGRNHNTKRFCYISSGEVYGQGDLNLDAFDETYGGYVDPTSPRSCYPNSKRAAETLCSSYSKQFGLETVIVRPCHTYGAGFTESDSRANAQFFRNVLQGKDIIMKSAGAQMRSYCYIADCASIIFTVLFNGNSGEAYNSSNSQSVTTIAGLAKEIASASGRQVIFENPSELDISNRTPIAKQVLSCSKVEALGWKGNYSVKEGVAHTLNILNGN